MAVQEVTYQIDEATSPAVELTYQIDDATTRQLSSLVGSSSECNRDATERILTTRFAEEPGRAWEVGYSRQQLPLKTHLFLSSRLHGVLSPT